MSEVELVMHLVKYGELVKKLESENFRLRKALEEIVRVPYVDMALDPQVASRIASEALHPKGEK